MLDSLLNLVPWMVVLVVFIGEKVIQWRYISVFDRVLAKPAPGQVPAIAPPIVPPLAAPQPSAPKAAPVPPAPAPTSPAVPFAGAPAWFQWALHEIGFHETGNNQGIERYIGLAHCGALGDPWCAIFANAALESSGIPGTRSASSQSPRHHPEFVQLPGPALGALAVCWRGSRPNPITAAEIGHVGFYRGEDAGRIWLLEGNASDMVQIGTVPKDSATFGLVGYWWPKSVPMPVIGPVLMPTGSPTSIHNAPTGASSSAPPGKHVDIVATMFGNEASAYGGAIDNDSLGVALPFHFTGERPKVRATNKRSGQTIECAIVDVGPWNTHDPYWQTGARPQAESGTDMSGRHTNGAGIDLTFAAAKALGIDGKGLVDWEFVTASPLPEPSITPKVT